ncbi:hypothetical protein [Derxia lacustris]|uniref:hypothetical protein n=1 Tax=Derxia lacustris TaxID=764842 RepID=UPI00111C118B|nr:hypothetical protein [Derxia lacustris]
MAQPIIPADCLRQPLNSNYKGFPVCQEKAGPGLNEFGRVNNQPSNSNTRPIAQYKQTTSNWQGKDCKTTTGLCEAIELPLILMKDARGGLDR